MKTFGLAMAVVILVGGYVIAFIGSSKGIHSMVQLGVMNMALGAVLVMIRLYERDRDEG